MPGQRLALSSTNVQGIGRYENDATIGDQGGAPILHVNQTHAGLVCPGKQKPDGIPTNFGLFQASERHFAQSTPDSVEGWRRQSLGEVDYKSYFDDMALHSKNEWTSFFRHPENSRILVFSHSVMYTLADICMKRGSLEKCAEVLEWMENDASEMMVVLKQKLSGGRDVGDFYSAQVPQFEQYDYLGKVTRSELNMTLSRFEDNVDTFREICAYETKVCGSLIYAGGPNLHLSCLQKSRKISLDQIPSAAEIRALPSKVFVRCMKKYEAQLRPSDAFKADTELVVCANCNKRETALGEFKSCQRCNEVAYCGRSCQRSAWKSHKKVCGKKAPVCCGKRK